MGRTKCCVQGCNATDSSHRLFHFPRNKWLKNLWLSILVPNNPLLAGLSEGALRNKRVCEKHFDRHQFDADHRRLRYSYPCLLTGVEQALGEPHSNAEYSLLNEHNYCQGPESGDPADDPLLLTSPLPEAAIYEEKGDDPLLSTSPPPEVSIDENIGDDPLLATSPLPETAIDEERDTIQRTEYSDDPLLATSPLPETAIDEDRVTDRDTIQRTEYSDDPVLATSPLPDAAIDEDRELPVKKVHKIMTIPVQKLIPCKSLKKTQTRQYIRRCIATSKRSLRETNRQILERARAESENHVLMNNFEKLNKGAKDFLSMQLKMVTKCKMGRRFSPSDKRFALALMKQSPKGYRLLENMFVLPNKRTLNRLSEKVSLECDDSKFEYIKNAAKTWDEKKKLCTLVFDEVTLAPKSKDKSTKRKSAGKRKNAQKCAGKSNKTQESAGAGGNVKQISAKTKNPKTCAGKNAQKCKRKNAPKYTGNALVFMVRGICSPWRHCVAYYPYEGTVSPEACKQMLQDIVAKLSETGLKVLALVCDQVSVFRSCLKDLMETTCRLRVSQGIENDITIHIAGQDMFMIFDPPRLLKAIYYNFLGKDILYHGMVASLKDILYVYDLDSRLDTNRALPKLSAQHFEAQQISKMKVRSAAEVLSATTAAMLNYTTVLHQHLNAPVERMATTATVVSFLDNLFDSVNGSSLQPAGKLRQAVKPKSPHMVFWQKALVDLKNIKFIEENNEFGREICKFRCVSVPSLQGWITTLQSHLGLSKLLFDKYGVKFYYTRRLNLDPLENFFGRISELNCRNLDRDSADTDPDK